MKINKRLPTTITAAWLESHDACRGQVELFERTWPKGVVVTQKTLASSAKAGLNLDWLAKRIIPASVYSKYLVDRDVLNAAHLEKRILVSAKYQAGRMLLYTNYLEKCAQPSDDYEAGRNTRYAEYLAERGVFCAKYRKKFAPIDADYMTKRNKLLVPILWAAYEKKQRSVQKRGVI